MIVAIDYETKDSRGASFQYFRRDFDIFSLSCCWRDPETNDIKHWFSTDRNRIAQKLATLAREGHQIVAHNLPYELGCTSKVFKHIKLNWYADTMRMTQLRDGGGEEFGTPTLTLEQEIEFELGNLSEKDVKKLWNKSRGLSLEAAAMRYLEDTHHSHKEPAHDWLKEHEGIKKDFGRHLDKLPYDMLEQYNNADTLVTLLLFEEHAKHFNEIGYNWQQDWKLFINRATLMTDAHIRGIKINQEKLMQCILDIEAEIKELEDNFMEVFKKEIDVVRDNRLMKLYTEWCNEPKTEKGKANRRLKVESGEKDEDWYEFKLGSSKQLGMLFIEVMGMKYQFETPKGSPSFKASHLSQWGEGGKLLFKRKKRLLVLQQCANVYLSALHDGRTHPSIKIAGTRTNRVAGGRD